MQFRHLFSGLALVLASATASAVELGEVIMRSHLGQPLSADVELTGLASDAAPVQVGLAELDVYKGASIGMHPALSAASVTTFRRDGRRWLHIGSMVLTRSDHVPIFFTLTENGQKSVRQVTLWLTPDPNPAPAPAPAPAPEPGPVMATSVPVAAPVPAPAPMVAKPAAAAPAAAPAKFIPAPASVRHALTLPHAPKAAACPTAGATTIDDAACVALDAKNVALNAHLVELEDKVKQLSAALQVKAAPVPAPAASPVAPKIAPVMAKPLPSKLVPMGSAPPESAAGKPWLVIGMAAAIILSLVAGLSVMLQRQRKKTRLKRKASELIATTAPPKPSFIASVKNRLMPARAAPSEVVQHRLEPDEVADTVPAL